MSYACYKKKFLSSTLLIKFKLVYGPFGKNKRHSKLEYCPDKQEGAPSLLVDMRWPATTEPCDDHLSAPAEYEAAPIAAELELDRRARREIVGEVELGLDARP